LAPASAQAAHAVEVAPRRLTATARAQAQKQAQEQARVSSVQRPARRSPLLPARPTLSQAAALRRELRAQRTPLKVALLEVSLLAAQEPPLWAVAPPAPSPPAATARAIPALRWWWMTV
jgi:hypothetical protein